MFEIIIGGTCILLLVGGFVIYFLVLYNQRQRRFREEKTAMQQTFQQELLRAQLEMQEQTLQFVGQEIHDNIGQTLSLAKLHLNTVPEAEQSPKLTDARGLVGKAITDLRALSKSLNAEAQLAEGLAVAVERALQQIGRSGEFETRLEQQGQAVRLHGQTELILFRIVQEALNNCIKHSGARHIAVRLHWMPSQLQILVEDDGEGIAPARQEGQGLRNMASRAGMVGAEFSIESQPGAGTRIMILIAY